MNNKYHPTSTTKIAFIGSGNMTKAIIGGLVSNNYNHKNIIASNPTKAKLNQLADKYAIQTTQDNLQAIQFADLVVFAAKPQKMPEILAQMTSGDLSNKLIVSVAAGFKTDSISKLLNQSLPIIRAMPNTPALIGEGVTGLFATQQVSNEQKQLAAAIFQSIGQTVWIDNESNMDIVTAVAGSGPAYFLYMMQSMQEQAIESGLTQQQAFELITQTAYGTAKLAQKRSEQSLLELREKVTSPGGTTAAAVESLTQDGFTGIIKQAVTAAINRGKALGKNSN